MPVAAQGRKTASPARHALTAPPRRRCNKLELLEQFEGTQRSCATRLAAHHTLRRRAPGPAAAPEGACGGTAADALSAGLYDIAGFLADAPSPPQPAPAERAFAAAAAATGLRAETLHVKLTDAPPRALPPGLRAAFVGLFAPAVAHELTSCLRPGCTLLTVDALLSGDGEPEGGAPLGAAEVEARLRRGPGVAGAFFRAAAQRGAIAVRSRGEEAHGSGEDVAAMAAETAPRLPPPSSLAVLSTAPAALQLLHAAPPPPGLRYGCRLHGRVLTPLLSLAADATASPTLLLAPCGEEGALRLEALPASAPLHAAAPPRAVLLCADAAIVAEVAAAGAALAQQSGGADDAWAHAELVVIILGAALRPRAPPRVVAAAAAAALRMGWHAALTRLLPALLGADDDAAGDAAAAAHFLALTCHAAAPGAPRGGMRALAAAAPRRAAGAALAGALVAEARRSGGGSVSRRRAVDLAREALLRRAPAITPPHIAAAAAAVLDALAAELEQRSGGGGDDAEACSSADADVIDAAEEEASYVRYLARLNAPLWRLLAAVIVIPSLLQLHSAYTLGLTQPDAAAFHAAHTGAARRYMLRVTRLHAPPPAGGPPIGVGDVAWADLVAVARVVAAGLLFVRIPMAIAQAALASPSCLPRRLRAAVDAHYDAVFGALTTCDAATLFLLPDVAAYAVTGRAVEWPAATLAVRGVALLTLAQCCGPLRVRANLVSLALRVGCAVAVLLYARAWRVLLTNGGYVMFMACAAAAAARAPVRDARMRAAHAEERDAERAAARRKKAT